MEFGLTARTVVERRRGLGHRTEGKRGPSWIQSPVGQLRALGD